MKLNIHSSWTSFESANSVYKHEFDQIFFLIFRAIGTGDSKGPLIFLRGISYHEIEAVLEFMYNGQTKVQQTELDAFLAAAEELNVRGLSQENQNIPL